jgi:hypothetical protein
MGAILITSIAAFPTINAQLTQQQLGSNGGLTATLNGSSFTSGDTITVSGTVEEREPNSRILIRVIDPQSNEVEVGAVDVSADNTFTYSFVAGVQEEFDFDEPMVTSGNYRTVVSYITPDFDREVVELTFVYNTAALPVEPETVTTTNQQAAAIQGTTRLFQSTSDSFSVQVPDRWVIHDVDNTGSVLLEEATQGYGILAQLCPQEEQVEEQAAPSNVSGRGDTTTTSCQGSEGDIIHIVRYPDLDSRLFANNVTTTDNTMTTTDNILSYHMQKLQEVGYRSMQIVNSTDTIVNLTNLQTNQTIATVPSKHVEITYSTTSTPNETRRSGYLISTATNLTAPNAGMTKGYTIFYEGSSLSEGEPTIGFGSLRPLPLHVGQILDSFALITAPEVAQALAEQAAEAAAEPVEGVDDDGDEDGGDEDGDDGDNGDEDGDDGDNGDEDGDDGDNGDEDGDDGDNGDEEPEPEPGDGGDGGEGEPT